MSTRILAGRDAQKQVEGDRAAAVVRELGRYGRWLVDDRRYNDEADRVHCVDCMAEFARTFPRLRMVPSRWRNTYRLACQGGHPDDEVRAVLHEHFGLGGQYPGKAISGGAFAHAEMWGKDGTPLLLVGHPYGIGGEAMDDLYAFRRLGLDVWINARSAHAIRTVRVLVFHEETVRKVFPDKHLYLGK